MFRQSALRVSALARLGAPKPAASQSLRFFGCSHSANPQFDVNAKHGFLPKEVSFRYCWEACVKC